MNYEKLVNDCENELKDIFNEIDNQTLLNSKKVIDDFIEDIKKYVEESK